MCIVKQLPPIKAPAGFEVTGGEVVYSGTCPGCGRRKS
jgi:Fur family transcriptional regulator, ferric uptake regulator